VWSRPSELQKINKEKSALKKVVDDWRALYAKIEDAEVLVEMAEGGDEASFGDLKMEVPSVAGHVEALETQSLLRDEMDSSNAFVNINAGAGGTEAQDWADILLRMYLRYAQDRGLKASVVAISEGDGAGIKSATIHLEGPYSYGHLKAENGVHRLVRISPYDSNARRHTSFASVFATPEIDDDIQVDIKEADLKIDTYRASGAGGQHVNKTDSAVRMTHMPTGLVVQCQSERSQHANRDKAYKMLRAALYELEIERRKRESDKLAADKMANEWGSQIRSYVLHPYQLVKDHRTGFETSNTEAVLDGKISGFVEAFLKKKALGELA
jgi:peptide chain release factor 2